jgi:hypothetical protein
LDYVTLKLVDFVYKIKKELRRNAGGKVKFP